MDPYREPYLRVQESMYLNDRSFGPHGLLYRFFGSILHTMKVLGPIGVLFGFNMLPYFRNHLGPGASGMSRCKISYSTLNPKPYLDPGCPTFSGMCPINNMWNGNQKGRTSKVQVNPKPNSGSASLGNETLHLRGSPTPATPITYSLVVMTMKW